jgi:hypothetical protein
LSQEKAKERGKRMEREKREKRLKTKRSTVSARN